MALFHDRADAGKELAESLVSYAGDANAIVLALPRGGVPVGYEIAKRLRIPLDVYVVRKLGAPGHEELAMGAVASDGSCVVDEALIESLGVDETTLADVVQRELDEVRRRETAYRDGRREPDIAGKVAIIVDDGLATGATMRVASMALRRNRPASIIVAVPVAAARTCAGLRSVADRVVCLHTPEPFRAVGLYYENFEQMSDAEVCGLLERAVETTGPGTNA